MSLSEHVSRSLARRSSRRQFFKFMGAGSLGAGLYLTGADVSLGSVTPHCAGCGGGPCNSCWSPDDRCSTMPCKPCQQGGGCPVGCSTSGEWFCCVTGTQCRQRCSECTCPSPQGCCHCFTMLSIPCVPRAHSGDQPCPCPPTVPLVGVTADAA